MHPPSQYPIEQFSCLKEFYFKPYSLQTLGNHSSVYNLYSFGFSRISYKCDYIDYSDWLLSPCTMHLRCIHVGVAPQLSLFIAVLYEYIEKTNGGTSSSHLLKDIGCLQFLAIRLLELSSAGFVFLNFFYGHRLSNQLGKYIEVS